MAAEQGLLLDIIILGASGFTGKYVLREFLKFNKKIGIAGRDQNKLAATLIWAGGPDPSLLTRIPILEADVFQPDSLASLCKHTKLLVSCVGPYSTYGEPVVAACVQAGVDYLDICGEPAFMESMEMKYHKTAVHNQCLIVSACGYDSIPAEIGVQYTTKEFLKRGWTPNSVDSYVMGASKNRHRGAIINFGTYESLILSLSNAQVLAEIRRSVPHRTRPQIAGIPARKPGLLQWEEKIGKWALKLPVADATVVRRTQSTWATNPDGLDSHADCESRKQEWRSLRPAHYGCYLTSRNCVPLLCILLMASVWARLVQFRWGKRWLLHHPRLCSLGIFSKEGPTEEAINNMSFSMWFVGKGYSSAVAQGDSRLPDKVIVTRITGPEMGYVTTPICLVQAALLVLDQRKALPKGGVFTPGAAFATTDLQERLNKNGLHFQLERLESHP